MASWIHDRFLDSRWILGGKGSNRSQIPNFDFPGPMGKLARHGLEKDLTNMLGDMDFDFEHYFNLLYFWDSRCTIRFTARSLIRFTIRFATRFTISFTIRFTMSFPDGAAGASEQTLRSQLDPSPNAPRGQIRRKVSCCDK